MRDGRFPEMIIMIKKLNNIIRKPFRVISNHKGQAAVVLILVTAVALVFYAISLNFGRLGQGKTLTTMSSDTGAAQLASGMAGYGQMLSKTQLDGRKRKCDSTSMLVAIISLIIVVIVTIVSWGSMTTFAAGLAIAAIGLSVLTVIMQAAIIQPGITDMWHRLKQKTMSTRDQIIENAIQGGLQKAVTDQKNVPDVFDMDGDRIWEPFNSATLADPADEISRLAFYYNERMKTIDLGPTTEIQDFVDALEELLYDGGDNWGIYDNSPFVCSSAECNPCCVLNAGTFYGAAFTANRPRICANPDDDASWWDTCAAISPYNGATVYPWAYQKYPENPGNAFISFREGIGRDDEHQLFEKNPLSPNTPPQTQTVALGGGPPLPPASWKFLLQDTTQYYVDPPFDPPTDNRKGIFPFFYKVADWGVDLKQLDPATSIEHCYWYDSTNEPVPECAAVVLPQELANIQATNFPLLNDPATLSQNTTWYVDGDNNRTDSGFPPLNPGDPPLAVDKITFPDNIVEDDTPPACAQQALATGGGFWKKGADRYCSDDPDNEWPYFSQCAKHGAGCAAVDGSTDDCSCEESGAAENFPEDVLDDMVYGLPDFIDWALGTLSQPVRNLKMNFTTWYADAALWIEPGTDPPPWGSNAVAGTGCFVCNPIDGRLITLLKEIGMMIDRLQAWKDNTSYAAGACDEVWCVPGGACAGGADSSPLGGRGPESDTFNNPDGDTTNGDVDDIIACLDWNVSDTVTTTDSLVTAIGNAEKFQKCYNACDNVRNDVDLMTNAAHANELCNVLPRSLIPLFDGTFATLNLANLDCGATCGVCVGPLCSCGACLCSNGACLAAQTLAAKGSCAVAAYMANLDLSGREAENQVAKFNQRELFLSNRVNEVNNILNNVLIPARDRLDTFLNDPNGPVQNLIQYRIDYTTEDEGLPYQAIYGWQDDPPPDNPLEEGRWHIVKVDARIPDKCDDACGVGGGTDPGWPRIKTWTEKWGTRRCYELVSTDGMVKFRTTRFDEPSSDATSLFFPNGEPIWTFRRTHIQRTFDPNLLVGIDGLCQSGTVQTLPNGDLTNVYQRAFMINKRIGGVGGNEPCWNNLHSILANGVSSEACAQYYWHEGTNQGMGFKFVDCANF